MNKNKNVIPKHCKTVFQLWYYSLTPEEKAAYAERSGTSRASISVNYLRPLRERDEAFDIHKPTRTQPRSRDMLRFVDASMGGFTYEDAIDHFYYP